MVGLCVFELGDTHGWRLWSGGRLNSEAARGRSSKRRGAGSGAECHSLEPRTLFSVAPVPVGSEFRANTNAAGSQELFAESPHAAAADADGDFVVTWSSSGQDGSGWGVFAQRYAADGAARGPEFRVNQAAAGNQWYPNVACDAVGNFVVAWTSGLQDGAGDGVYARRYAASGAPAGDEFRVNTTTADNQRHPSVAMNAGGAFVVTWGGLAQAGGAGWDVYAQRYNAAGVTQGGEVRVNTTTAGDQQFGAAAIDPAGNFIATWTTDAQDGSGTAVYARRFGAGGAALGGEFRVNTVTAGNQQYSRAAVDSGGGFVVAWASAGQDGSGRGIYAQRYTPAGARRGAEFLVNQVTAGEQFAPAIAGDAGGGFVVTWTGAQDGDGFGVFARAYDAAGISRGGEFRVNTHLPGNQVYSAAAGAADGRFVVVWQSDGQDGSGFGVYGQRYAAPDITSPAADVVDVAPDPRASAVDAVAIRFSEAVTGFDRADVSLVRDGLGVNLLTGAQTLAGADGATFTLGNLAALTAMPGTYRLTVVAAGSGVVDAAGNPLAGDASDVWTVVAPPPARVVARHVFYNGSALDGRDTAVNAADDDAIAADKQALPPGGAAGFANYTSYPRGINGVMIDVAGWGGAVGGGTAPATAAVVSPIDFAFHWGNGGDPSQWAVAAPPTSIGVRAGAGVDGSDRVTLVWGDSAVAGGWLQLTMLATAATKLAAPDVFFFGSLPGETGDDAAAAAVGGVDFVRTRAAIGGAAPASSRFDHDRDGDVDVRDLVVVRAALGGEPLHLLAPSASKAAAPLSPISRSAYRPLPATAVLRADSADAPAAAVASGEVAVQ